jgi:hypothetical protein
VKECEAFIGKAHDEARLTEVVDLRDRPKTVEESLLEGRSLRGSALNGDGEASRNQ